MGQQFSLETLTTTDAEDGYKYWSSFEPYPNNVGKNQLAYLGILNGDGPRKGEKCVVKAFRNGFGTYSYWNSEVLKAQKASEIAKLFNKEMKRIGLPGSIKFNVPMLVEIDEVSSFMCISLLLGKPRKKMKEFEIVSVETYLDGEFEEFSRNSVHQSETIIPDAFTHYSWCKSKGEFIVCNMKGIRKGCNYHFTVPTVHSVDSKFGKSDRGRLAIENFFSHHQCNNLCKDLPKAGQTMHTYATMSKGQSDLELLTRQISDPNDKNTNSPEQNEESMYILRNYPIRVPTEQTRLLQQPCTCAFFRIPCPHRGNSSFIYAPSAPDESTIGGNYV